MLEKIFHLSEYRTSIRTEILAGVTTFMTMAYILFVNPNILSIAGIPHQAVFFATAVGAGLATIAMGLFVNYPIALAPGMGLNAFYTFTVVQQMGISWQTALGAVFLSGIIFILLTVTQVRQLLIEALPDSLKHAITVGIGLFITIIGLKTSGLMTIVVSLSAPVEGPVSFLAPGSSETIIQMGNLHDPNVLLALAGLLLIALLMAFRIQGAILIGIILTTLLGIPLGITQVAPQFVQIPDFSQLAVGQLDILGALKLGIFTVIFTFTFVELFDSLGTIVGTAQRAGIADSSGKFPRLGRALLVDAFSVSGGALLGTSTITAYVESASGIAQGGRTGLTAIVTGLLFLVALFFAPIAGMIPVAATGPALVIVGLLMIQAVARIDFEDFTVAFPAFMTIILMPFTYSIANGISAGLILYPLLKAVTGQARQVHWILWILFVIVATRYVFFIGG